MGAAPIVPLRSPQIGLVPDSDDDETVVPSFLEKFTEPSFIAIGRLTPSEIQCLLPERDGAGVGAIFVATAAAYMARRQQRVCIEPPVGGFSLWALEAQFEGYTSVSLANTVELLRTYGATALYPDRRGEQSPRYTALSEADTFPNVSRRKVAQRGEAVRRELESGRAVMCTWLYGGVSRIKLSDGSTAWKALCVRPEGIVGDQDRVALLIVGYDHVGDVFFGHCSSVSPPGKDGLLCLSTSSLENPMICGDISSLILTEHSTSCSGVDPAVPGSPLSATTTTTTGDFDDESKSWDVRPSVAE